MGEALISRASGASGSSGSNINLVQETGTSETDVMSQKAVSENVCFGSGAVNTGTSSSTFGSNARATEECSSAFGYGARATGNHSSAFGHGASATKDESLALGKSASATGDFSEAFGNGVNAGGYSSSAFGHGASATGSCSSAFGANANASASYSVALGLASKATEFAVVSVGDGSTDAGYGKRRIVNVQDPKNMSDVATKRTVYGDVLFEDDAGSTGDETATITLSASYKNYERIGIYFFGNVISFQNYSEFLTVAGGGLALSSVYPDSSLASLFIRCAYLAFTSETSCQLQRNKLFKISNTGLSIADAGLIKITKIVGLIPINQTTSTT